MFKRHTHPHVLPSSPAPALLSYLIDLIDGSHTQHYAKLPPTCLCSSAISLLCCDRSVRMDSWLQYSRLLVGTLEYSEACKAVELTLKFSPERRDKTRPKGRFDESTVNSHLHRLPPSGARLVVQHVERVYPVVRDSFSRGGQHEREYERNEEHVVAG